MSRLHSHLGNRDNYFTPARYCQNDDLTETYHIVPNVICVVGVGKFQQYTQEKCFKTDSTIFSSSISCSLYSEAQLLVISLSENAQT